MTMSTPRPAKARSRNEDAGVPVAAHCNVLVVEDEPDLQDLLRYNLERDGFAVTCVGSAEEALHALRRGALDLALLDLMLPGMDGLELCRKLRAEPSTAALRIIMLTAKGEEADIVAGLELGADDYVVKPFSPRVLLARIKSVRRRPHERAEAGDGALLRVGDLVVDDARHEVRFAGRPVAMTYTKFRIVQLLARRPGRVFTRSQVVREVQGEMVAVTDRSVDVHVVALRKKLGEGGKYIQTVRGVGCRLEVQGSGFRVQTANLVRSEIFHKVRNQEENKIRHSAFLHSPPILQMICHDASSTGCTERRVFLIRGRSFSLLSCLIRASVTGFFRGLTTLKSTMPKRSVLSVGSG